MSLEDEIREFEIEVEAQDHNYFLKVSLANIYFENKQYDKCLELIKGNLQIPIEDRNRLYVQIADITGFTERDGALMVSSELAKYVTRWMRIKEEKQKALKIKYDCSLHHLNLMDIA